MKGDPRYQQRATLTEARAYVLGGHASRADWVAFRALWLANPDLEGELAEIANEAHMQQAPIPW